MKHKAKDPKKGEIYKKIDAVSQEASKYAIANEYDKATSSLELPVPMRIPGWMKLFIKITFRIMSWRSGLKEKERFSELVRLFPYRIRSCLRRVQPQDNDGRLVN
jgi:hypothetical protein